MVTKKIEETTIKKTTYTKEDTNSKYWLLGIGIIIIFAGGYIISQHDIAKIPTTNDNGIVVTTTTPSSTDNGIVTTTTPSSTDNATASSTDNATASSTDNATASTTDNATASTIDNASTTDNVTVTPSLTTMRHRRDKDR